eukprot:Em0022g926a
MLKARLTVLAALLTISVAGRLHKHQSVTSDLEAEIQESADQEMQTEKSEKEVDDVVSAYMSSYTKALEDAESKNANNDLLNYMTYAYLTPTGDEEIDYVYASRGKLSCSLCTKAVRFAVPKILKRGCSFLFKVEAIAACEAIGLGPEDPLSSVCIGVLIGSCKIIASQITKHVTDPAKICKVIKLC